ncbi:MAG: DUF937 domain-containing protein [Sphaerospermopsis sp. SIO1G2]|nr:DUF937 domain-containing protein [Sphaerospermopsis sp. SIO1G1]NET73312.1 DUF937 domain-containing protein [Sphaerospermopsis sp. SIO1G2]
MGLFDQILGSVAGSQEAGGMGQLIGIANTINQISNSTGADTSTIQSVLSVVGKQVHSSLQQKQADQGMEIVESLVNQFAGTNPDSEAVDSLFSSSTQQQVSEVAAERTGLDPALIQQLLPTLVPLVLNFLQAGGNPLLTQFLDADGDGDVDITDAIQLASRFLGK